MDPDFQKCTFLAFHSLDSARVVIYLLLLVIEVFIIIERCMRMKSIGGLLNKGRYSRDAKWGAIGRRSVSHFNEYMKGSPRDLRTRGVGIISQGSEQVRQPICPYRLAVM